jgi:flagellar biosynthesis protein FliQ
VGEVVLYCKSAVESIGFFAEVFDNVTQIVEQGLDLVPEILASYENC